MYILVTYDVNTMDKAGARRLRKVAKACLDYGHRVQNSVFECELSDSISLFDSPVSGGGNRFITVGETEVP